MSKTIKILLLSSLVLNILLIGFILGTVSQRFFREDFLRRQPPEIDVKIPPEKEKLFSETMEQVRKENRTVRRQMRETRQRIFSILTAPEFDEASYQAESEKLQELRGHMMRGLSNTTKKLARQMNQEERKALAEYLRRSPREDRFRDDPRHPQNRKYSPADCIR
jgi:uncharacterized membrane protein